MDIEAARQQMIDQQVRSWDVLDTRVLDTLRRVRREVFVPEALRGAAFGWVPRPMARLPVAPTRVPPPVNPPGAVVGANPGG